jgi:predicted nucleic-acid-binding Zn-ribbon protein
METEKKKSDRTKCPCCHENTYTNKIRVVYKGKLLKVFDSVLSAENWSMDHGYPTVVLEYVSICTRCHYEKEYSRRVFKGTIIT